jgi:hypothetical protein
MEVSMTRKRNRQKPTVSFDERLRQAAEAARQAAVRLEGSQRDLMLQKARQAETALHISGWLLRRDRTKRCASAYPETSSAGNHRPGLAVDHASAADVVAM